MCRGRMQPLPERIIVGARGSTLSLCQTNMVIAALRRALGRPCAFALLPITTLGDRKKTWSRSDTGIFVKELEEALLAKRIDMAVHSVKDLPSVLAPGLLLAAVTRREDCRDVLITRRGYTVRSLPANALVGTTSLRRRSQILRLRPDLRVADLRGNLDTRIAKLLDGQYDAIVVAAAGVKRLAPSLSGIKIKPIAVKDMLPAVGQGALGIEVRSDDTLMRRIAALVDHRRTRVCVETEREYLKATQAGCRMPVAGHARISRGRLFLNALVISLDGSCLAQAQAATALSRAAGLGGKVAAALLRKGGAEILRRIRHEEK